MEMFKVAAKIDVTHVPFKGVGPAVPALLSGEAHMMMNAIPELLPHTKGGKLRVIGSLTEKRHPFIPDVPTFIEQGYKDFVMGNWTGIVAPAKTPKTGHRQARDRDHAHHPRARNEQAPRRHGRRSAGRHAGGIRQADPRGDGALRQGGQGLGR